MPVIGHTYVQLFLLFIRMQTAGEHSITLICSILSLESKILSPHLIIHLYKWRFKWIISHLS